MLRWAIPPLLVLAPFWLLPASLYVHLEMTAPIYIWALLMSLALNKVWRRHRLAQHGLDPNLVDVIKRKKHAQHARGLRPPLRPAPRIGEVAGQQQPVWLSARLVTPRPGRRRAPRAAQLAGQLGGRPAHHRGELGRVVSDHAAGDHGRVRSTQFDDITRVKPARYRGDTRGQQRAALPHHRTHRARRQASTSRRPRRRNAPRTAAPTSVRTARRTPCPPRRQPARSRRRPRQPTAPAPRRRRPAVPTTPSTPSRRCPGRCPDRRPHHPDPPFRPLRQ